MYWTFFSGRTAVAVIGETTSCSSEQLQSYADHAKTVYSSDLSTWDSATISNVGNVLGR